MRTAVLGYLEPVPGAVLSAWLPRVARVEGSAVRELAEAWVRIGGRAVICRTKDEARAELDDIRGRCEVCQEGAGRHRCNRCQEDVLEAQLRASQERPAAGGVR